MSLRQNRDVTTGRRIKTGAGEGRNWEAHRQHKAWWTVSAFECEPHDLDGHTFEVCLFNISRIHSSPIWPIIALTSEADALKWAGKLQGFAKTLPAENQHAHFDKAVNGDARLAAWLTENGFTKYNHVWWVLLPSTPRSALA